MSSVSPETCFIHHLLWLALSLEVTACLTFWSPSSVWLTLQVSALGALLLVLQKVGDNFEPLRNERHCSFVGGCYAYGAL
jgi:hypothetical protein